jgi:hypothetical protein
MISKKFIYLLVFTIGILLLQQVSILAKDGVKDKNKVVNKTLDQVARTYLDINNISTQFYNNGIGDIDPSGNAGVVYPKGSGKTAVFTAGLLWGGLIQGDITNQPRVGGTAYRTGLQSGAILSNGQADDPSLDKYRIYRVRPDVKPGGPNVDLSAEASNENSSAAALRTQFEKDWTEWPGNLGAPYTDVNGNGVYDPAVDIPGVTGADMTVWFIANDMSSTTTTFLYGAQPIGIEVQATYWAYSQTGALGNMYFRKYRLVNKGFQHNTVNNMYLSMWADVDDGDAGDDFVGVDTSRSLQYCYNASAVDAVYNPLPPPAVGFDFFQGPLAKGVAGQDLNRNGVDDAADFAIFNGKKVGPGLINLPMTAAYYFANGDLNIGDPPQGDIQGSTQFYNFFRGRYGISGAPFIDPTTGQVTTFALPGDPQTRKGWIDGSQLAAGDRRQGSASGPFTLAPGDTQEVVVAEIVAGAITGVDRLAAIGLLKFYDDQAQLAYNNFFNLPTAPPAPIVKITPLNKEIILDWGEDTTTVKATENSSAKGYTFEGYNVYQLPSASATIDQAVRLATFDVVDNILKIEDQFFDPLTGVVAVGVKQFGNDTGIKRFLDITTDQIKGGVPLVDGIKYYFAVTSYSYNPDPTAVPNNLENPIAIFTVVPQSPDPGVNYPNATGVFKNVIHTGTADGSVTVNIVDPAKVTGDIYQVFFTQRAEVRNENGDWVPSGTKKIKGHNGNSPDTLTGSSIDMAAVYGPQTGTINLNCSLTLAGDGDLVDGIKMVLPAGVTIINVPNINTNNSATIIPIIQGNTIILGDVNHGYSKNGPFAGDETWSILVKGTVPIATDWTIYDDNASGGPIDVSGTTTVTTIGKISRLAKYWNVKDSTTQKVRIVNQSVINGVDIFPRRDDIITNLGLDAAPIVDGLQISLNVGYKAPINYFSTKLTTSGNTTLTHSSSTSTLDIQNYTIFGGTVTSTAKDNFSPAGVTTFGTSDINVLQKDYILKFTGVWDSTKNATTGQVVHFIKPGTGSLATIFQATSLATHPLNPTPGTNAPFLIRIPFEVWSKDDNRQVNLMFRDRIQTETESPFWAWNPINRMYAILVNSPYDTLHAITRAATDPLNALATWVLVFYGTNYTVGDQVVITYANPIQIGSDKYTFTPGASTFSTAQAKNDVQAINVFPNPYYGVNSEELNKYNRFVTFNHLPARATIRVFNLAGVLVQTIDKNDPGQFARWDLNNQSNLPVASGLYIAYIDMPGLGTTKILKIAIIQEQQILDRF